MLRCLLFLVMLTVMASCSPLSSKRSVILTTDVGCEVDDQWAMTYLLRAPELETLAIITTHAPNLEPPAAESAAVVARQVLGVLDLEHAPPVIAGSSRALESPDLPLRNSGVDFILESSRGFASDNRLVVLTHGATTDLASALLTDPDLAERVEVVTMGFLNWPDGGDPWNIKNDLHAYRVILESGVPITVGSAAVCQAHLTVDRQEIRVHTRGLGRIGDYLRQHSLRWIEEHRDTCVETTGREAWVLWDLVTVAHLLGFSRVETRPRPQLGDDCQFILPEDETAAGSQIGWISALDAETMWRDFRRKNVLEDGQ